MLAVSAWHLRRDSEAEVFRRTAASLACCPRVDLRDDGRQPARRLETTYQPMKVAAMEGAVGDVPAVLLLGVPDRRREQRRDPDEDHRDPAPALAAGDRLVERAGLGLNELNAQYQQQYGPGDYVPNVFIQYWSMRVMAYSAGGVPASPCGADGSCGGASSRVASGSSGWRCGRSVCRS